MSFVTFEEKRTNSCNGNILSEISVTPFNNCGNINFRKNLVPTRRKFRILKIPLCVTGRIMLGTFRQLNRPQNPIYFRNNLVPPKRNETFVFWPFEKSHSAYMVEFRWGNFANYTGYKILNICFSSSQARKNIVEDLVSPCSKNNIRESHKKEVEWGEEKRVNL